MDSFHHVSLAESPNYDVTTKVPSAVGVSAGPGDASIILLR
jgi:hypothetical protein